MNTGVERVPAAPAAKSESPGRRAWRRFKSNRLGFVKNEKDPVKVENALRKLLDPAESSDFCHRLVLFGREHCTARSPKCEGCPLGAVCPSYPIAK